MNWDSIGIIGYIGLALALAVLLTWLAYWGIKRRILARVSLGLAVAAYICASVHSATHVNRIRIDPAAKLAEMEAKKEARKQAALDSRGDEVAQIQFAEDDGDEFLDKAGLEESDLKYLEKLEEPEWKKEKKTRSTEGAEDDSLEGMIDDTEAEGGADVEALEEEQAPDPILMTEEEVVTAHRLDRWNLKFSASLSWLALVLLAYDYLRRANIYAEASMPLPLPSGLPGSITPMPPVVKQPTQPRRSTIEELIWLARRGDSFIYMTDEPLKAAKALERLEPIAAKRRRFEILRTDADGVDEEFVFESLWFNRASFVVDSPPRIEALTQRFITLMKQRCKTRAKVRQVAHIVWDIQGEAPSEELTRLIQATGLSLFLCQNTR